MVGLYLHIPFCRRACSYCNFHFSTSGKGYQAMVDAICRELELRVAEIPSQPWSSIYFGGGTPSLLSSAQVSQLLDAARSIRELRPDAEVTLEANPDDLDAESLEKLALTPINRLSIGVQSFRDQDLSFMRRIHTAASATLAIRRAQAAGFRNMTIDLIYGTPGLSNDAWLSNLDTAMSLEVPHISAYSLTVEPRTALAKQISSGRSPPLDEEQSAQQMEMLVHTLSAAGYEQYEVSSFAQRGFRAVHNSSYWLGAPYLGVGPSAHSYDGGHVRSWNVANNARYKASIAQHVLPIEREQLSACDRYNELVLTRLRTVWGVSMSAVQALGFADHFQTFVKPFLQSGWVVQGDDAIFRLSADGKLYADAVSEALFAADPDAI